MTAKNLLQSLKSDIERESQFTDNEITVQLQSTEKTARATVFMVVEGKTHLFEVQARDLGVYEGLENNEVTLSPT